ncbi:hypothetical protein [Sinanaerobacter chloroacetimidivorans]|uniref:Uncharacterized protein n=1 Tax=Sinanaerobacter chloroacetimidivorans TaxID=2818044 RepID=A0A8J8B066_9FIRM|nr:hypothetical protein [Sinanaerobacter chloroacetimidivorans]MBR0596889.1 hypothetical protein [Sinanaerobacter chloroacetimidivorans]
MNNIKKAGIVTGAVVGGVIGGTISVIGKVSKKKFIDDLGESVVDSTILTGGIAGDIASGAASLVSGKITNTPQKIEEGKKDLKSAGNRVIQNFVGNVKTVVNNSGEILEGVKERDRKKVVKGTKNLAKVIAVGAITVGTIKIKPEADEDTQAEDEADEDTKAEDKADEDTQAEDKADEDTQAEDKTK